MNESSFDFQWYNVESSVMNDCDLPGNASDDPPYLVVESLNIAMHPNGMVVYDSDVLSIDHVYNTIPSFEENGRPVRIRAHSEAKIRVGDKIIEHVPVYWDYPEQLPLIS